MTRTTTTTRAACIAVTTSVVLLASCGSAVPAEPDEGAGAEVTALASGSAAPPDRADTTFLARLAASQVQAEEMSALASGQAGSSDVRALAEEIVTDLRSEREAASELSDTWEQRHEGWTGQGWHMGDDTGQSSPGMMGRSPGMMGRDMMGPDRMHDLGLAQGEDFDRMYLELMIEHHQGVLDMAGTQVDEGQDRGALDLAETVILDRRAHIARMQGMLETVPSPESGTT